MFAGTALSVRLLVYAGLSLFIINRPYVYVVVCVVYAYNLTLGLWPSVMAFWCGLLVWPSGMAFWFGGLLIEDSLLVEVVFCYGLLLWPSGMAFWYGLLVRPSGTGSLLTETFNQKAITEGHYTRRPYQYGLLVRPSGVIVCYAPCRWLLLRTVRILLDCILVCDYFLAKNH